MGKRSFLLKKKLSQAIDDTISKKALFLKNPERDFTRNRKLSLKETIRMLISLGAGSLDSELMDYCTENVPAGVSLKSGVSKTAFIRRQEKIPPEMIYDIFLGFNRMCQDDHTYNGLHLYAIDGSVISYPGYKDDRTYASDSNETQIHANCMYDICNKTYTDIELQPQPETNEVRAACNMIRRNSFPEHSVIMMDRGYLGLNLLEYINRTDDLDFVIRAKRNYTKEIQELPDMELDMDIENLYSTSQAREYEDLYRSGDMKYMKSKNWDFEETFIMKMRVVKIRLDSGEYETLITSLPRDRFPPEVLKKLYHMRWGVETSFRELKYDIGMIGFHSRKEESIDRVIIAKLILYNFCMRIAMNTVMKRSRKERRYLYQINYSRAFQICTKFFKDYRKRAKTNPDKLLKRYITPIRDDRSDQRKMNRQSHIISFSYRMRAA